MRNIKKILAIMLTFAMIIGWVPGVSAEESDPKPSVKVDPATYEILEKDSAKAVVNVILSEASVEDITVNYATSDGSATSSKDYIGASGTITIPSGETSGYH